MPSAADIALAITAAQTLNVTPSQMVSLLDAAIASALVSGTGSSAASGLPAVTYTINGRSRTISMKEAQELREYYNRQAGGAILQLAEL
jgi:hypothetical protein